MKTTLIARALALLLLATVTALHAQVPQLINYQGRVAVGTVNFDGTGSFKFALVNAVGTTTFWSNDGTSTAGSQPTAAVSLTVTKGLYSVLLGDTALANMTVVPATVFTNPDVRLRVWFNDGTNGSQLLTPDQRLAPAAYLADGTVTSASIGAGTITAANIASNTITADQLAPGAAAANLWASPREAFSASRASASASMPLPWGSFTIMGYNTVEFDESANYNNASYQFTAPVNGIYIFDASSGVVSSGSSTTFSNDIIISLFKNGVEWRRGARTSDILTYSNIINVSVHGMGKLVAGDMIDVRIYQKNSDSYTVSTEQNAVSDQFSGYRLH